ncbi:MULTISPECIES: respiratory chain complex I subunit 1 family protein [Petrotoga]|uniref:Membrane bound protein complex subunit mbxM n=2 Tax=Petrotoga sibirica TaxID=156202 RepID=A0A4R8F5C1_9BACT|nr:MULTISPECIES: NADH-quinone oxidoreductase subunit H [Petrotoga]KUK83274.1 MAG: Respiratory-chain NADH dehydrogenase subunit 1 [Petrotoga mobilis]POZ88744.1 NADH dehydrogenase [Petrotoga sibirica DSM 13575]POZ90867.1 NADH dehydrogenase [Petrotoga sp. SL27]TDX17351.1 Membrane bound protein complex subunit mbxM [Petrotoga sibirica]
MSYLIALMIVFIGFLWQVSLDGIQRRVTAKVHRRVGPPWYQTFMDIFKALSKSSITHGFIYDFGVMMALGGTITAFMFLPFGNIVAFNGLDNFFVVVYLSTIGSLGMAMSASGSGNAWAGIGIMRALTQMLAYEVPFMIVVFGMIHVYGTSSLAELAHVQQMSGIFGWHIFTMPLGAIVAFISLVGMLIKVPFDTPIAPAEIASGPMVEYGGKHLGMLMLQHEFATLVEVGLFVNLFLGGGNLVEYLIKYFFVYTLVTLIYAVSARFRIENVVTFFYGVPIVLSLVQTAIVIFTGLGVNV